MNRPTATLADAIGRAADPGLVPSTFRRAADDENLLPEYNVLYERASRRRIESRRLSATRVAESGRWIEMTPEMTTDATPIPSWNSELDAVHHVAICVDDVAKAIDWYTRTFRCKVSYQDATWAMLDFANIHLAIVTEGQHPPHIGFTHDKAEQFGTLKTHRDGTRSTYLPDPAGNAVEILDARSVVQ